MLASAPACPRCGTDPASEPVSPLERIIPFALWLGITLLNVGLLVCIGLSLSRALSTNLLQQLFGSAGPTATPTLAIQHIIVVATHPPPTPTPVPGATPAPASNVYPAPQLASPPNGEFFHGADAAIALEWEPVTPSGLAENEWYMVSVYYTDADDRPAEQTGWSKETRWTVRSSWWSEASPAARVFQWRVTAMRIQGVDPYASSSRLPVSPPSATRSFTWR